MCRLDSLGGLVAVHRELRKDSAHNYSDRELDQRKNLNRADIRAADLSQTCSSYSCSTKLN